MYTAAAACLKPSTLVHHILASSFEQGVVPSQTMALLVERNLVSLQVASFYTGTLQCHQIAGGNLLSPRYILNVNNVL